MNTTSQNPRLRRQLDWVAWVLLVAVLIPVCEAQDFWMLACLAAALSWLGIWLSHRAARPLLNPKVTAAIALALGAVTAIISVDAGTIGVYAVADWLIAVAILKCWQLGTSRDYAHVLIITGLLLLVGSLVSWQLGFAIALTLAVVLMPSAARGWHLMAEQECWARLTGRTCHVGIQLSGEPRTSERLYGISVFCSLFCAVVAFVIFAALPRLRTPLQPAVRGVVQPVTGFSAEARLNDIGRLQTSQRVVMRVRLSVAGEPIGRAFLPYFHGMSYSSYDGYQWEAREPSALQDVRLAEDASLTYFRHAGRGTMPGAIEQEYWVESGPLPCLLTLRTPVAVGSQEIHRIGWRPNDDSLLSDARLPAAMHYKVLSVPAYVLTDPRTDTPTAAPPTEATSTEAASKAEASQFAHQRPPIHPPSVSSEIIHLARSLAREVTDEIDPPAPAVYEQVVNRFIKYLQSSPFTYSLDPPQARGLPPLDRFLLAKRGHCEYFATALAVFCKCVNIPARYVTGFHGGTYNEVGNFHVVRDSDAHSWVEVWLPDRGWTDFDPTPSTATPGFRSSLSSSLTGLLDYLQFQWSSWVVAYDVLHRQDLLGTFGNWMNPSRPQQERSLTQFLWMFRELLAGPETLSPLGKLLYWLGLLGVLSLSGYLAVQLLRQLLQQWRLYRRTSAARQVGIRFYERVVSALARRRLMRRSTETPREFARRVEESLPQMQGCFLELIEHYYALRYGRAERTSSGEHAASKVLRLLERPTTDRTADGTVSP